MDAEIPSLATTMRQTWWNSYQDQEPQSAPILVKGPSVAERIRHRGPWDQQLTPALLAGPPSLPMPVEIARPESLDPIFSHIQLDGNVFPLPHETEAVQQNQLKLSSGLEKSCQSFRISYST